MAKSKLTTFHVLPRDTAWAVVKEYSSRASSVHTTQREAIEAGQELARAQQSNLLIHKRNGSIRARHNYSPAPMRKAVRKVMFPELADEKKKQAILTAIREVIAEKKQKENPI